MMQVFQVPGLYSDMTSEHFPFKMKWQEKQETPVQRHAMQYDSPGANPLF